MWDTKCQKSFYVINKYLTNPPVFIPPHMGVPFHLYIYSIDFALGLMLAQQNKIKREQVIYYLSCIQAIYETRYAHLKKLWFVVVFYSSKVETLPS